MTTSPNPGTINEHAVFAYLDNGQTIRLTRFMSYSEALTQFDTLANGRTMQANTLVWERDRMGNKVDGGPKRVEFFMVRHQGSLDTAMAQPWARTDVLRMSERTYTTEEGAIKAWNRATGSRYAGRIGGHIYDVTNVSPRRIGQGWYSCLAQRAGLFHTGGGLRFTASKVTVRTTGDQAAALVGAL